MDTLFDFLAGIIIKNYKKLKISLKSISCVCCTSCFSYCKKGIFRLFLINIITMIYKLFFNRTQRYIIRRKTWEVNINKCCSVI